MMKIRFKNVLTRENLEHPVAPAGDHFHKEYKWRFDDDGKQVHIFTGKIENRYEMIQAERDGTDLKKMFERYENGDATALSKVQAMYLDTVDMPKTFAELYNAVSMYNDVFASMPAEIKEEYNNNPAEYWKAFGTEEFDKTMNAYRSMIYANYGMVDPEPVNTTGDIKVDVADEVKEGE